MNTTHAKSVAVATVLVALAIVGGACSSSGKKGATPTTLGSKSTLAESKGFDCPDPVGDIGTDTAASSVGKLSQPSGVDLTHASAKVQGEDLVVSFQTVGDIATAAMPLFDLLQGDLSSSTDLAFELRATPATSDVAGPWTLALTTFHEGIEKKTQLATPVTVTGNTLSYQVPLKDLPAIATLEWQFGSSSPQANGPSFIDDCNSLKSQPPTSGGTATSSSTTATTKG